MQDKLKERLGTLRQELERGQHMKAELEAKLTELNATLLRISGAIQVLEELLHDPAEAAPQT